jgi:hypothetical protein
MKEYTASSKPKLTLEQVQEGWTVHGTCVVPPGEDYCGES